MTVDDILKKASDAHLAKEITASYTEVEKNFVLKKWKVAELDAGHFVESVRRLIELKLFASYTPLSSSLPSFSEAVLKNYENAKGDESYRILIPRVLFSLYTIRNKRGVGHIGLVKPNEIDATLILQGVKWTMAELIRLNSTLSLDDTTELLHNLTQRQIDVLWKHGGMTRVLDKQLRVDKKVLVLLFDQSPQTEIQLQANTKYRNKSDFQKMLKKLDADLLIDYDDKGNCSITPLGEQLAEQTLSELSNAK